MSARFLISSAIAATAIASVTLGLIPSIELTTQPADTLTTIEFVSNQSLMNTAVSNDFVPVYKRYPDTLAGTKALWEDLGYPGWLSDEEYSQHLWRVDPPYDLTLPPLFEEIRPSAPKFNSSGDYNFNIKTLIFKA